MVTHAAARAIDALLPAGFETGLFVGRLQLEEGPTPVLVREGVVLDVSRTAPTVAELVEIGDLASVEGPALFAAETLLDDGRPPLLAPIDLQVVKAAGVTFAVSAIERVIEERARGDAGRAAEVRRSLESRVGGGIRSVVPGTAEAGRLKAALIEDGMWSQYLEVAIGPHAEIFTKAPVLSSVGWGAEIGVRSDSSWNNPEPEVVLIADRHGRAIGATLGNDVNLRDFEGRSALLLGKAKDNNASCAIGPLIRVFDGGFGMDAVRSMVVELAIDGAEGYRLRATSAMQEISRDPEELVRQTMSEHQYPDGFALFLGTLFAPVDDRDAPGLGFTHREGDVVRISSPQLGTLTNRVTTSKAAAPWRFGIRELIGNLASRGLLDRAAA